MAINVGDLVRITDDGYNYSSYTEMFRQLGFSSLDARVNPYSNGDVLRVFAIGSHPDGRVTLYGLEPVGGGTQILMNNNGIEYVFPGNWHIKVTEENSNMLGEWRSTGFLHRTNGIVLSEQHDVRGYWIETQSEIPTHCQIEITTEQFIQHVLNQTDTNMPQELTPEQQYRAASDAMNLQPGDVVRVARSTPTNHMGWSNSWDHSTMDRFIGNEYFVERIADPITMGVRLTPAGGYNFPVYSLEVVSRVNEQVTTPEPPTNLENEQEDAVVTTTEKVICITDKWNYVNLGEVYEVIKRDEYYTYVKDNVNGESRYAHHYFEEWVDAETKAKRDSFKALFGDHSGNMFKNSGDDVQKLLAELYPKLYTYTGWLKLNKDSNHDSKWLFDNQSIRLMSEEDSSYERIQGALRFDPNDYTHEVFNYNGYNYIRFKRNR